MKSHVNVRKNAEPSLENNGETKHNERKPARFQNFQESEKLVQRSFNDAQRIAHARKKTPRWSLKNIK